MEKEEQNVLSLSGGKDSTAMLLLAIERGTDNLRPVFCDTGNEHRLTYEYVQYLEKATGIHVDWVKADFAAHIIRKRTVVETKWRAEGVPEQTIQSALSVLHPTGNPFLDMCIYHGRFPASRVRFCSFELKQNVIKEQVHLPLLRDGFDVLSWQGVRRDESPARACAAVRDLAMTEETTGAELWNYRPILDWTAEDCFAIMRRHGIEPNPLYKMGMSRVGCMPCIHSRKEELREIGNRFPEEIERIAQWETIVKKAGRTGTASFFAHADEHGDSIHAVVEWSRTARGGRQLEIFAAGEQEPTQCSSKYGLCE